MKKEENKQIYEKIQLLKTELEKIQKNELDLLEKIAKLTRKKQRKN